MNNQFYHLWNKTNAQTSWSPLLTATITILKIQKVLEGKANKKVEQVTVAPGNGKVSPPPSSKISFFYILSNRDSTVPKHSTSLKLRVRKIA